MTGPCVSHQLRGWTGLVYMWGQGLREQEKYARALKAYTSTMEFWLHSLSHIMLTWSAQIQREGK